MPVSVTFRRSELVSHKACGEGLALFDHIAALAGNPRRFRVPWTPLAQLWFATAFPSFASWLVAEGLMPPIFFPKGNLRGANLDGAYLRGAYLGGANLRGAYLRGANLDGAYLRGAYLGGANLRGAYLRGANLGGANLGGANLDGAYLRGANLDGANLRGANLRGANLGGANLRGANLRGANLDGANLRGAYLRGATIAKSVSIPSGYEARPAGCDCCVILTKATAPRAGTEAAE